MATTPVGGHHLVTFLAHQGGWDEILLVAGPIVVIIIVLAVVKRRGDAGPGGPDSGTDEPAN